MIIDCHCHAGPGDGLTGPWDSNAALGRYARRAREAGIDRTVLLAAFHSDYGAANAGVARLVAAEPDRYLAFAFVHARRDAGRIGALVRKAVEEYGFAGIKLHRHDAPITGEVCEVARHFGLPVLYDPVGVTSVAELLAEQYPDVNFILPHLGSFADDWSAQWRWSTTWRGTAISTPTAPACAASTCWSRQSGAPVRTRSCSAPTVHGCTPAWNWRRSACCGWGQGMKAWSWAATCCA